MFAAHLPSPPLKTRLAPPDDQIEADLESTDAAARAAVRIRLRDHDCQQESASDDAELRYRRTLERSFGGAVPVAAALRAYLLACESDPEELEAADRASAEAWVKASQRANADALSGLEGAEEAWFEVTASKSPAACPLVVASRPVVPPVAPRLLYVPPAPAELPTDLFPASPSSTTLAAACETAPARTRTRTKVAEPLFSPQFDLF